MRIDCFIIIIIIIIIIVSFMQGIHTHIPETKHFPRGYTAAAILSVLLTVPLSLVLDYYYYYYYYYYRLSSQAFLPRFSS